MLFIYNSEKAKFLYKNLKYLFHVIYTIREYLMTTFRLKLCTHVPTYTIYQKFQHTKKYIFERNIKSKSILKNFKNIE